MDDGSNLSPLFTWRSALCESDLPPTTRHVLLTLSLHMNERGGSCFPSSRILAAETGLTRRTVESHLRKAVALGWIEKAPQSRRSDGTFTPAQYRAMRPGERASHGPGETDALPGETDDIDQGKEIPHRTSVQRGRQKQGVNTPPKSPPRNNGGGGKEKTTADRDWEIVLEKLRNRQRRCLSKMSDEGRDALGQIGGLDLLTSANASDVRHIRRDFMKLHPDAPP